MKYYKFFMVVILCMGFTSHKLFCDTNAVISHSQQVSDALGKWFDKKTLISAGALVGSALLGVALYKAATRWINNYFFPQVKEFDENVDMQEIPYNVIEQLNSADPYKIEELRKNPAYKNYIDKMLPARQ